MRMLLFGNRLAGWRRGYAADCKSVTETAAKTFPENGKPLVRGFCKPARQTENEPKTLQTSGWWILPAVACGLAVWLWIFHMMGVL